MALPLSRKGATPATATHRGTGLLFRAETDQNRPPKRTTSQAELDHLHQIRHSEFPNWKNRIVPPLRRPHEGIEIDPQKMHGTPVLTGTRVPFDLVIDLCSGDEAMDMEELKDAYPSLDRDAIEHALDFESAVKEWSA